MIAPRKVFAIALVFATILLIFRAASADYLGTQQSELILTVDPSSVVIKVGDRANATLSLTGSSLGDGEICLAVEGFPSSGFVTTITPTCLQSGSERTSILTVEATPAAAPQNFTAYVVATSGNWTVRVPFNVTVVPALPAWIPWSIILVFILILIVPLVVRSKRPKRSEESE